MELREYIVKSLALCLLIILFSFLSVHSAHAESEGLAHLDSIVSQAKDLHEFLSRKDLVDQYFEALQEYYGKQRVTREKFDRIINQMQSMAKIRGFAERMWETTNLGKYHQVELDVAGSGLELKPDAWKNYYEDWQKKLREGSQDYLSVSEQSEREKKFEGDVVVLSKKIEEFRHRTSVLRTKREREDASNKFFNSELLEMPEFKRAAAYMVHQKINTPEFVDYLSSQDADVIVQTMKELKSLDNYSNFDFVPKELKSRFLQSAVPDLELPKLELKDGKPLENDLFMVRTRQARNRTVPVGRVAHGKYEFIPIPRRIHGVWAPMCLGECVWESPQRWGLVAIEATQFYNVERDGGYQGSLRAIPGAIGASEKDSHALDLGSGVLSKQIVTKDRATGQRSRAPLFEIWFPLFHKQVMGPQSQLTLGESYGGDNASVLRTVRNSRFYKDGELLPEGARFRVKDPLEENITEAARTMGFSNSYSNGMTFEAAHRDAGQLTIVGSDPLPKPDEDPELYLKRLRSGDTRITLRTLEQIRNHPPTRDDIRAAFEKAYLELLKSNNPKVVLGVLDHVKKHPTPNEVPFEIAHADAIASLLENRDVAVAAAATGTLLRGKADHSDPASQHAILRLNALIHQYPKNEVLLAVMADPTVMPSIPTEALVHLIGNRISGSREQVLTFASMLLRNHTGQVVPAAQHAIQNLRTLMVGQYYQNPPFDLVFSAMMDPSVMPIVPPETLVGLIEIGPNFSREQLLSLLDHGETRVRDAAYARMRPEVREHWRSTWSDPVGQRLMAHFVDDPNETTRRMAANAIRYAFTGVNHVTVPVDEEAQRIMIAKRAAAHGELRADLNKLVADMSESGQISAEPLRELLELGEVFYSEVPPTTLLPSRGHIRKELAPDFWQKMSPDAIRKLLTWLQTKVFSTDDPSERASALRIISQMESVEIIDPLPLYLWAIRDESREVSNAAIEILGGTRRRGPISHPKEVAELLASRLRSIDSHVVHDAGRALANLDLERHVPWAPLVDELLRPNSIEALHSSTWYDLAGVLAGGGHLGPEVFARLLPVLSDPDYSKKPSLRRLALMLYLLREDRTPLPGWDNAIEMATRDPDAHVSAEAEHVHAVLTLRGPDAIARQRAARRLMLDAVARGHSALPGHGYHGIASEALRDFHRDFPDECLRALELVGSESR
jgi:hypothetical protein